MATKRKRPTVMIIRHTDPDDYEGPEGNEKLVTPGKPEDFKVYVDDDILGSAPGDKQYQLFHQRAVGPITLGSDGAEDHSEVLAEFINAISPFFPHPSHRAAFCPEEVMAAFATRMLQEGIALGLRIAQGEILGQKKPRTRKKPQKPS